MSGDTAATRALQHYTSMARAKDEENAGQLAWLENDYYDDEEQQPRTLFCGGGMGALCAAIHHLHPHETATPALAKKKEYMQQQHVRDEDGIPSSEIPKHTTASGEVAAEMQEEEDDEQEDVEIGMHASAAQQQPQQQQHPMSRLWQRGHDDISTASEENIRRTRSFSSSFLLLPSLPTTTLLTEMRTTLRGTRPPLPLPPPPPPPPAPAPAPTAVFAAGTSLGETNSTPQQLPPTRQQHQQLHPYQGQRLHAIPASQHNPQKFVLCMSCSDEEWLKVPQTAKYVRCPVCTSITIALASNTRFPAREERRVGGGACTRLMAFLSVLQQGRGGPASL